MKKGFTLSEVLITLGIVGAIAAITVPAFNNMRPDETKMKFMKAYNALANLAPEIANDETLFPVQRGNNGAIILEGLACFGRLNQINVAAVDPMYNVSWTNGGISPSAANNRCSFAYFLQKRLNVQNNFTCNAQANNSTFTTVDGIGWTITYNEAGLDTTATVTIDTDGVSGNNCSYTDICTNPDRFILNVDNYGSVAPGDALSDAYLKNATDMHARAKDKAEAAKLFADKSSEEE